MVKFSGEHDHTQYGQIKTNLQVFWSKKRAWHGEEVTISVRGYLDNEVVGPVRSDTDKSGAGVKQKKLEIVLKILDFDNSVEIDTVKGEKLTDLKLDHKYKIEWQDKKFGDMREFVVKALAANKLESETSSPLLVDLDLPLFSA